MFGKQDGAAPFFVWLGSVLERSHSIFCLVGNAPEQNHGNIARVSD
jgi:hypothetical protein